MKFIIIFGPHAVGKMTVGQELEKLTGIKLFHNHMSIDLVAPFFSYGTKAGQRLVSMIREGIFAEFAKSDEKGLIFTFIWGFNEQSEWDYIDKICNIFESEGGEVYFVELVADLEERLKRNKTPNRLNHKPMKQNIEWSDNYVIKSMEKFRMTSNEGEITRENFIKINNTYLSPEETAKIIKDRFNF
ncbi:MAG: AAA family ATPase [Candidatus Delongbacteria bacterium]|jgi:hemolysin-activating ACP:hemolysin acyltransferase|nr:AAA family ATPase [Candidatus Delongbacteria bacterium]